jgi:hypothetical protein
VASQWELSRSGLGLDNRIPQETLGILKWTETGNGCHTESPCQENKEGVKFEQRPATVGVNDCSQDTVT